MVKVPESHPRYFNLVMRERLVEGVEKGIAVLQGLIAQGRGEAFDYILGERTHDFALQAERVAIALMLTAKHPVISVNGNAASLVAEELVKLSKALNTPLEVNIFHWKKERIERIKKHLENFGTEVLAACDAVLEGLHHARRVVDGRGIYIADVVLVALEDGDRCEILKKHGKKVIAIDLNPLSRTARMADISIVDNITRAIPAMVKMAEEMNKMKKSKLKKIVEDYDNRLILKQAIEAIRDNLTLKALEVLD